jgi:hypothetical protein
MRDVAEKVALQLMLKRVERIQVAQDRVQWKVLM